MTHRRLGVLVALALVAAGCGGGSGDQPTETTSAAEAGATAAGGVTTAESPLGEILVDGSGRTLYLFTNDTDGMSTCDSVCAATWPPVPATAADGSTLDEALFGEVTREDGPTQLTVAGHPVYLYAADVVAGDVSGQGSGGVWYVIDPTGAAITEGPASTGTTEPAGRYDY